MIRKIILSLVCLLATVATVASEPFKVLAIGNSFSQDAVEQYLHELAEAGGQEIIIGNMYIGGCSLERHYNNMLNNTADYAYRKIGLDGIKHESGNQTIEKALADEQWDYVSLQQVSGLSGDYSTYNSYLPALVAYVKEKVPTAKLILHQTWSYAQNSTHSEFARYGKDQMKMYNSIIEATTKAFTDNSMDLLIPCGTAIQNARTTFIGDYMNRDGYHLNVVYGRYTAACTWYEALFKTSVVGNSYAPEGMNESLKLATQTAAHEAVSQPYTVTDLSYIQNTVNARKRFVNTEAKGLGDGSSWDDAMSFDDFYANVNSYDDGDQFLFAGGVYKPSQVTEITKGLTLIGGFSPQLTGTDDALPGYPSATPTVFSGDKNNNGIADNGDAVSILNFSTATEDGSMLKAITLRGIEFTGAYDATDGENHGALWLKHCGYVSVENCRFYGNVGKGKLGGMAITSQYSRLVATDCQFFNNEAKSRGAALRFSSNDKGRGVGIINRCAIFGNKVTEGVGSAILVQHGKALYIVNSTIADNESTATASGALYTNGKGDFENKLFIVGSTIAGNKGGSQVEMAANAQLYAANAIIVGDETNKAYNFKGAVTTFASGGYNVSGSDEKLTAWDATDRATGNTYANVFGSNRLNNQLVIIPQMESSTFSSAAFGDGVSTWEIPVDITVDQLGSVRADNSLPGAYVKASSSAIERPRRETTVRNTHYNIDGVRLNGLRRGINIVNGKKLIIK